MSELTQGNNVLAFDIGGSGIRAAFISSKLEILSEVLSTQEMPLNPTELLEKIRGMGEKIIRSSSNFKVCIGFPGPIGPDKKIVISPTLFANNVVRSELSEEIRGLWKNNEVWLINDVAAYGYYMVAQGQKDFCVINVGSGIGSKLFVGGHMTIGPNGRGGEIGHWRDSEDDENINLRCDCGGYGHVGGISSGRGIERFVRHKAQQNKHEFDASNLRQFIKEDDFSSIDNMKIAQAFRLRDSWTTKVIGRASLPLARSLTLIHLACGVEKFFLTGGMAVALGEEYERLLAGLASNYCWENGFDWFQAVKLTDNNVEAALLGSAYFVNSMECSRK